MTLHYLVGLSAVVLIVGFVIFTFWKGDKIKPDPNNRQDGGMPPGSVGTDGAG
jgi:hypothetical protein